MRAFLLCLSSLLLGAGCADKVGELVVDPAFLDFGEVDFMLTPPLYGYDQRSVDLINEGERDLDIRIPSYDRVHLCLEGYDSEEGVIELTPLPPGSRHVLLVGVCGYDHYAGELGSTIEGRIQLVNDGRDPLEMLEFSLTPVIDQGQDTGD